MKLHEVEARVGYTEKLTNGYRISVSEIPERPRRFGSVALHEAHHVVASDGEIEDASIRPTDTSLGHTIPRRLTPEGVAAPAAFGDSGVGWDLFLASYVLRVSPEHAKQSARSKLLGQHELVEEVAATLEEKTTIYQSDVEEAKESVRRRREGVGEVDVSVTNVVGEEVHRERHQSRRGKVIIKKKWLEFSEAA